MKLEYSSSNHEIKTIGNVDENKCQKQSGIYAQKQEKKLFRKTRNLLIVTGLHYFYVKAIIVLSLVEFELSSEYLTFTIFIVILCTQKNNNRFRKTINFLALMALHCSKVKPLLCLNLVEFELKSVIHIFQV